MHLIVCFLAAVGLSAGVTVRTSQGTIEGEAVPGKPSVHRFRGIPFATQTRWRRPGPEPSLDNFKALKYGEPCAQLFEGKPIGVEDCLTVNVWTNVLDNTSSVPLGSAPVMVWIYGGSFLSGSGSFPVYDPVNIVARHPGLVAVTLNYRLGPFGFLGLEALKDAGVNSGNFGIEDQRAAMVWVQRHISAFGGDPNRVTIVGESAGGISVCLHTFSPLSRGLFRSAIIESGNCGTVNRDLKTAFEIGSSFVSHLGCKSNDLKCAEGADVGAVFNASDAVGGASAFNLNKPAAWLPIVDGINLETDPYTTLLRRDWQPVPILMGANHESFSLFIRDGPLFDLSQDKQGSLQFVEALIADSARISGILKENHPSTAPSASALTSQSASIVSKLSTLPLGRDILISGASDAIFLCGTRRMALAFSSYIKDVYYYSFRHHPFNPQPPAYPLWMGAYHFAEVPFVFNQPQCLSDPNCKPGFTAAEVELSNAIQDYWVSFIQSGVSPNGGFHFNGPPSVLWPAVTAENMKAMAFNLNLSIVDDNNRDSCEPWDNLFFKDGVKSLLQSVPASPTPAPSNSAPNIRSDAEVIAVAVGVSLICFLIGSAIYHQANKKDRAAGGSYVPFSNEDL